MNILLKTYLSIAVVILMFITSIGIYGFLVSAYQSTADQLTIINKKTAVIDMKRTRFKEQSNPYKLEKEQIFNGFCIKNKPQLWGLFFCL
jgi:hypothetical protein